MKTIKSIFAFTFFLALLFSFFIDAAYNADSEKLVNVTKSSSNLFYSCADDVPFSNMAHETLNEINVVPSNQNVVNKNFSYKILYDTKLFRSIFLSSINSFNTVFAHRGQNGFYLFGLCKLLI